MKKETRKIGRPLKEVKTKRVQCIIPETVLQDLDKRVGLLPKSERDRSKVITLAINEWLKPNKKKRSKNVYLKFFGFIDYFLYKGLWGSLNTILENDKELEILNNIKKKLVLGESPDDKEIECFNNLLAKQKFYIDNSLKLNCSSKPVMILAEMLFLNRSLPMKDYAGYCKECGVFFYKEKAKQLFHSPICKLKYYEKIKKSNQNPLKESRILAIEKDIKDKALKSPINISEILRSIDPNKNNIDTVKELVKGISNLSGNKFSIFKELWKNIIGKTDELLRLGIDFFNQYIDELIKKIIAKGNINALKNYTIENFADDVATDFFAETGKMKNELKKWLLKSLTPNRFYARKNFVLGTGYLEKEQEKIEALNKSIEYYENTFEKEYNLNNNKLYSFEKNFYIIIAKTELIQYEKNLDKRIELYVELLKEDRLNLGIYLYLICTYFVKLQEKNEEKYRLKIIYYYKCFRRIKKALGLLGVNKIKSEKRFYKELSTCPIYLQHYPILTAITAYVLAANGQTKEALETINQPDARYVSDKHKNIAANVYIYIFSILKDTKKGIEALEKLDLKPETFEEKKKKLLEESKKDN